MRVCAPHAMSRQGFPAGSRPRRIKTIVRVHGDVYHLAAFGHRGRAWRRGGSWAIQGRLYASPPSHRWGAFPFETGCCRSGITSSDHRREIMAVSALLPRGPQVAGSFRPAAPGSDPDRWAPAETIQRASRRTTPAIIPRTVMWANGPAPRRVHEAQAHWRPCASGVCSVRYCT
jgi:hypothetical protein